MVLGLFLHDWLIEFYLVVLIGQRMLHVREDVARETLAHRRHSVENCSKRASNEGVILNKL